MDVNRKISRWLRPKAAFRIPAAGIGRAMAMKKQVLSALFASTFLAAYAHGAHAAVEIDADDIGGVVTGPNGPEAGVWVIAETYDLENKFIKIVVTDDRGRYVIPDLPEATYSIFARGYGLKDSEVLESAPGKNLDFKIEVENDPQTAAQIYPANYWFSLIEPPPESEFPGTGPNGNGINPGFTRQQHWMGHLKENCHYCHQQGTKATREVAGSDKIEAWDQRLKMERPAGDPTVGVHGPRYASTMMNNMTRFGRQRGLKMFADWSSDIETGAVPHEKPPRPDGVEQNIVITLWDWADGHFIHDEATSDKRDPTVNAGGPVYGVDTLQGYLAILDPNTHENKLVTVPGFETDHLATGVSVHNPMLDQKGRVWMTMLGAEGAPLEACEDGSNKYSAYFPNGARGTRRISIYDPETGEIELVPVCFGNHHINFGYDEDNTVYFSGDSNVVGWMNLREFDETGDSVQAMGWCPMVLDTNADGKIDPNREDWNQPDGDVLVMEDPDKDTRIFGFPYGLNINPVDDSIWYAKHRPYVPSALVRIERGANPPETCKAEYYEPPQLPSGDYAAYNARGVDMDSKGIAWVAFGSGQLGKFDRSKCKVLNGPTAIGQHCPEGWTLYDTPGPKISGQSSGSADWHYLTWVDLHNTLGLGKDIPILPGSNSDSLLAFLPDKKEWVVVRVPYPMGFYTRGMDGRIDDPNGGWKARGVWADYGEVPLWHQEDGFGAFGKMVQFQVRPNPLAH